MRNGRGVFIGRCYICGEYCGFTYCHEHKWCAQYLGLPYRRDVAEPILDKRIEELMRAVERQAEVIKVQQRELQKVAKTNQVIIDGWRSMASRAA